MPRPASRRPARARLTVQSLEDRSVPAYTLSIDGDAVTANVDVDTSVPGLTTFTATGTGANVDVADLMAFLELGDVVVSTGTGGGEAGGIEWIASSAADQPLDYFGDLHALVFRTGADALGGDVTLNGVLLPFADNVDLTIDTTAGGDILLLNDTRVMTAHSLTLNSGDEGVYWESGNTASTVGSGDFRVTASSFNNQYDGAAIVADGGDLVFDAPIALNGVALSLRAESGSVTLNERVDGPGSLGLYGLGGVAINADVGAIFPLADLTLTGGTTNYGSHTIEATAINVGGVTFDGIDATLGGTGDLVGNVTVSFDGILAPGGVGPIGTIPVAGNLTFDGGTYAVDLGATADRIDVTGDVTLDGAVLGGPNDTGTLTAAGDVSVLDFTGDLFGEFVNAPAGSGLVLGGDAVQVTNYGPAGTGITVARILPTAAGVFTATDLDGTPYTARLTGPGQLTAFRDAADRLNLVATGTTTLSSLTVTARPNASDDLVNMGDVRVNGSLNRFAAATGLVVGDITATQTIKSVTVYRAFGTLTLGGLVTDRTTIKADGWFANVTTPGVLSSVTVARDFNASLTADAVGTVRAGHTLGGLLPGWNVNKGITSITAGRIDGLAVTARNLGTLTARGDARAHLAGDIIAANVRLTGNDGTARRYGLKTLTATGTVQSSTFAVQEGSVLTVRVGRFLDSNLYLDYTPVGPFDTGTFDSGGHFTLGSFTTTAVTGTNPANPTNWAFANSQVAADTIGTVRLSGLRTNNGGVTPFGIKFRTAGGSVQTRTADTPAVLLRTNLTPSPAALAGDFFYLPFVS